MMRVKLTNIALIVAVSLLTTGVTAFADDIDPQYVYVGFQFPSGDAPIAVGDELAASFITATPLGDNLVDANVTLASWSMGWIDGSEPTIGSAVAGSHLTELQVWTDSRGEISGWVMDGVNTNFNVDYTISDFNGLGGSNLYDEFRSGNTTEKTSYVSGKMATWTAFAPGPVVLWSQEYCDTPDAPEVSTIAMMLSGLVLLGAVWTVRAKRRGSVR